MIFTFHVLVVKSPNVTPPCRGQLNAADGKASGISPAPTTKYFPRVIGSEKKSPTATLPWPVLGGIYRPGIYRAGNTGKYRPVQYSQSVQYREIPGNTGQLNGQVGIFCVLVILNAL